MLQVLLNRNYRGDIDNSVIDSFISLVNEVEDESLARPLIKTNDCTFAYIKVNTYLDTHRSQEKVLPTVFCNSGPLPFFSTATFT